MTGISRRGLQQLVEQMAEREGKRSDLDDFDLEELRSHGESLVDSFFDSVSKRRDVGGGKHAYDLLEDWSHRNYVFRESDWRDLSFNREGLQEAAEQYLTLPWLHCVALDWLAVDMLTFAECMSTHDYVRSKLLPASQYAARKTLRTGTSLTALIWSSTRWLLIASFWIGLLAASFSVAPVGPIVVGVGFTYATYRWRERRNVRDKVEGLVNEMFLCYENLQSVNFSWRVLWEDLTRTRQAGAVWPPVVYRLVELRTKLPEETASAAMKVA